MFTLVDALEMVEPRFVSEELATGVYRERVGPRRDYPLHLLVVDRGRNWGRQPEAVEEVCTEGRHTAAASEAGKEL